MKKQLLVLIPLLFLAGCSTSAGGMSRTDVGPAIKNEEVQIQKVVTIHLV